MRRERLAAEWRSAVLNNSAKMPEFEIYVGDLTKKEIERRQQERIAANYKAWCAREDALDAKYGPPKG